MGGWMEGWIDEWWSDEWMEDEWMYCFIDG